MDSGSKGQAWVNNLRHRFNTFCSEADEIICSDSVKYVRTKFIAAHENLMHLCSEIVEDVLHDFSVNPEGEKVLAPATHEEDVNFPAQKMLSIGNDTDLDGKLCAVKSPSTLLPNKPVGETCADTQSDGKVEASNHFHKQTLGGDECSVHAYSLTTVQPPGTNSSEKAEESKSSFIESQGCELPDEVTCSSSGSTKAIPSNESSQSSCCEKLDGSIIMVNSGECYSDSDMEANDLSLEGKIASEHSSESASQGIYSEIDRMTENCCTELLFAKDSRIVNGDFCDWEII
ncbi:hypothetical protein F511_01892 [Dorcoceras hygrometricum]|uniref:Uncharacterized protein n=1 Tax=Dorcoceras hygrometricum TaxID=472368 RepID=A0A2Z7CVG2_9LAMI|nr:hypothetical protein F511_01892 [Dorcoceras hygrometricum]